MQRPRVDILDFVTPRPGRGNVISPPHLAAKRPRALPLAVRDRRKAVASERATVAMPELESTGASGPGSYVCSFCIDSVIDYQPRS